MNTTEADIKKSSRMKQPHKTRKVNLSIRRLRLKKKKKKPTDYYYRDLFKSLEGLVGVLSRLKVLVDVLFCAVGELIAYLCFMVFSQFMVYRMTSVVTVPHTPAHLRLRSPLRRRYRNWYTHTHTDTHTYKS